MPGLFVRHSGLTITTTPGDCTSSRMEPGGLSAPTETGPQPYNTGGEVAVWTSGNEGDTWEKVRLATGNSSYNHTYVRRPVNAHPEFYAFWADGHARQQSESRLYFCNSTGEHVFRLPLADVGGPPETREGRPTQGRGGSRERRRSGLRWILRKGGTMKGIILSGGLGYPAVPAYGLDFKADYAHLRQTDDLLPSFGADAGQYP